MTHLGLQVDRVLGWCWGEGKTAALESEGAAIYVGDHLEDMRAAARAGIAAPDAVDRLLCRRSHGFLAGRTDAAGNQPRA